MKVVMSYGIFKQKILQGIKVENATGEIKKIFCEKAILCCGAWSKTLFDELPIELLKSVI